MRPISFIFSVMTPVTFSLLTAAAFAETPVATAWGTISEPTYPSHICIALPASLIAQAGSIDAYDVDGIHTQPDRDRLQHAIDGCSDGAVKLVRGRRGEDSFLTGPLTLKSEVTLWIDKGVTLFASRDPKDYDVGIGDCGTANTSGKKSCRSLIEGHSLSHAGLMGEGKIDGRGGSLLLSGPNKGLRSWWDIAWQSKQGLTQHNFRLVQIDGGDHLTLFKLTFENSPNFHIVPNNISGITAWGIRILSPSLAYSQADYDCPANTMPDKVTPATCFTPETVKNTDGFDPGNSENVLLAYSYISTGDDNVAIKAGGKGKGARHHVYAHNHFYYGHGMSLGSETDSGMDDIWVSDLTLDGMDSPGGNGLRIKSDASRGGQVRRVTFDGVCMRNEIRPLVFDTYYSEKSGSLYPDFQEITVRDFHYTGSPRYGGGTLTFRGYAAGDIKRPIGLFLDTVRFDGVAPKIKVMGTHFQIGPAAKGFGKWLTPSAADDVTTEYVETRTSPPLRDCTDDFLPLKTVMPDSPF